MFFFFFTAEHALKHIVSELVRFKGPF